MNNGAIVLKGGGLLRTGGADIYNNGSISGSGTLDMRGAGGGTLFNHGTVAPGTSTAAGTLSVQGNYTQGSNGVLDIKLGGTGAGEFDLLDVDGSARLGGSLHIHPLGAFAPANAASADFIVARGGSNSGAFEQVVAAPVSSAGGVATLSVSYPAPGTTAARVTASVVPSLNACVATPSMAGCASVLPSLAACTATPTLMGCSVVLPSLAMCSVSPTLAGCSAVLPPATLPPAADICTIAPNSALCQVLSPPTASEPVKPVQQASNEVIRTITTIQLTPVSAQSPAFTSASKTAAMSSSVDAKSADKTADKVADKTEEKKEEKKDDKESVAVDKIAAKNDPPKKTYCN